MLIIENPKKTQATVREWKLKGESIGLVTTMGCLHEAHLALLAKAQDLATKSVATIFVNPLQFGPTEDFEKYPRPLAEDISKLRAAGCDLLFLPHVRDFYPEGFSSRVSVAGVSEAMEGRSRPGHFEGVATVVLKLINVCMADYAVFGEKDFQQLCVIRRMVEDLNIPVEIIPHPTVREIDGIAKSSRNRFLSDDEKIWARRIPAVQGLVRKILTDDGGVSVGRLKEETKRFLTEAPLEIDYIEIASSDLNPCGDDTKIESIPLARMFIAVKAGSTRLIDNFPLRDGEST
jgi:pantoate--beta-alanine ligase